MMNLPLLERLWDENPQLFREIKGRFKPRNLTITVAISLLIQLLLLMGAAGGLPSEETRGAVTNRYCTGVGEYSHYKLCVPDGFGGYEINWSLWALDGFTWLSAIGIFALLVAGTHMLISDLSREENRGTLNFIRLTPQSAPSILMGKLLGVPSLLFLGIAIAIPLHLGFGLAAHIPFSLMLLFYGVVAAACLFFYSASILFSTVSVWLGGFQAWLGSGAIFMFFLVTTQYTLDHNNIVSNTPADWLPLFNPVYLLLDLANLSSAGTDYFRDNHHSLTFFGLPLGGSIWRSATFMLLNYGLWTYWAWQALNRCFHNPDTTIFSKRQSYLFTAGFEVVLVGFSLASGLEGSFYAQRLFHNFNFVLVFNLLLCLFLIATLSPHRQALQDWARYRHQNPASRRAGILPDLIWGEKSPSLVAVGLNLAIMAAILLPWLLVWSSSEYKLSAFFALLLSTTMMLIYACVAQLMLLMKAQKRAIWATATVGTLIVLPLVVFGVLSVEPRSVATPWLFSAFAWAAVENATTPAVIFALLGEWLTLAVLGFRLTRQLQKAGESHTKALFAGRASLPGV